MKNFTTEQLDQVRELAARAINPRLIAQALDLEEISFKVLVDDASSPLHKAYMEGHLQAKVNLHEAIIKSAMNGSNPSQLEMKKLIQESENYLSYG